MADDWKRSSSLKSWAISRTRRWKGSFLINNSQLFWYLRISLRATVPGRHLLSEKEVPMRFLYSTQHRSLPRSLTSQLGVLAPCLIGKGLLSNCSSSPHGSLFGTSHDFDFTFKNYEMRFWIPLGCGWPSYGVRGTRWPPFLSILNPGYFVTLQNERLSEIEWRWDWGTASLSTKSSKFGSYYSRQPWSMRFRIEDDKRCSILQTLGAEWTSSIKLLFSQCRWQEMDDSSPRTCLKSGWIL